MRKRLVVITALLGLLLLAGFVVFLISQTAQVVALADRVHPALGQVVLWGLLGLYAVCVVVPVLLLLRLPAPLAPPSTDAGPAFERHLGALTDRLRRNPLVSDRPLGTRADIEAALKVLDQRADALVRRAASQVLVTTAISQNGSLDALVVLVMQSRLIWRIAHVYCQRPGLRELARLYANVAGTALISSQLEDLDLTEQVQPILTGVLGSAAGAVPGLQTATTIVVASIVTGTANAFLTLRVGLVARSYCGALVVPDRRALRRSAISQAAQMLGLIAMEGAKRVATAFLTASRARTNEAARGVGRSVRRAATAMAERFRFPAES